MKVLLILLVALSLNLDLYAQGWDYEKYPPLKADIQHLNADLNVESNGELAGDVLYRAVVQSPRLDSLELQAAGIEILSVEIDGSETPFIIRDDKLIITPMNALERGQALDLRIQYETESRFGVHLNTRGTVWTSMLPKTTRHWLPVKDHPRERFTTELIITYPAGYEVAATGMQTSSEVVSVDKERAVFRSTQPVSPVHLSWVLGDLIMVSEREVTINRDGVQNPIQVDVYSETALQDTLNIVSIVENALLSSSEFFGRSYPQDHLHVVILNESYGETKSYGSGLIFAYQDKADLVQQIESGVLSQWAGVMVSEEQWSDSDAIHALHAFASNRLFSFSADTLNGEEPYDSFSNGMFSRWRNFLLAQEANHFEEAVSITVKEIFRDDYSVLSWNDLSEMIYHNTGLTYFEGFNPPAIPYDPIEETRYEAVVNWNEADQTVEISFTALDNPVDELVSVRTVEKRFDGTREHTITFTGEEDRSVISVSPAIENIQLYVTTREDIDLAVEKPFMFWIDQLRNDPDPEERAEAAEALAGFTDNPDLQLALNDLLGVESHPAVYAEILRSLSKLTAGDAGMEQRFLPYLSEDRNREVRLAAIESLANFDGNERVISQLRSIAINSEDPVLKRKAIQSLSSITDAERYVEIVNSLVTRESLLNQVPMLLQNLADKGEEEAVVDIASTFTAQQFPYDVRMHALELLLQYDRSPDNWSERLLVLFNDQHPHIRMRAAEALRFLAENERETITPTLLEDSYDERVRRAIRSAVNL